MAKKQTSSKKHTAKATSQIQSTTSSTTESTTPEKAKATFRELTPELQRELCDFLLRGASPFGVCKQLGVSLDSVKQCYQEDSGFRRQMDQVPDVLSQNVAAALYREAMEGNVSAQVFWLKTLPPPGWQQSTAEETPRTFDETLEQLTDEELFELARAMGVYMPHESSRDNGKTSDEEISPHVS